MYFHYSSLLKYLYRNCIFLISKSFYKLVARFLTFWIPPKISKNHPKYATEGLTIRADTVSLVYFVRTRIRSFLMAARSSKL